MKGASISKSVRISLIFLDSYSIVLEIPVSISALRKEHGFQSD
jgi:hypothetical protein